MRKYCCHGTIYIILFFEDGLMALCFPSQLVTIYFHIPRSYTEKLILIHIKRKLKTLELEMLN